MGFRDDSNPNIANYGNQRCLNTYSLSKGDNTKTTSMQNDWVFHMLLYLA